mgnify:CR=1 FL=1
MTSFVDDRRSREIVNVRSAIAELAAMFFLRQATHGPLDLDQARDELQNFYDTYDVGIEVDG